jgi:hypothetical protein
MTKEKVIPPPAPEWLYGPARCVEIFRDALTVRNFIEAVMLDDASFEAGLWQGEMPSEAMEAMDRILAGLHPYLVTLEKGANNGEN